ncbi:hypothetical protein LSH36_1004g00083 [Paralvinella palmiformis]|uniref:Protein phosphatase 1L n=1 Tax=Paralvinella palmiformis TaxID=53620 RepID=A0AAD9MSB2_9ANNE|nr:hypothetical protein LSH36_1004g00083 [Paralvinella palmiformis]
MTLLAGISRSLRKYLLNTESIMLICFCVVVYYYIFHGTAFWTFLERLRIKLELKVTGRYDRIPVTGDKEITSERSKASWELRKDNVGVYAIQGRRPYMEDRFNVVTDLERTKASIYGIFDGHGGEFAADFTEKTLFKTVMVRLLKSALVEEKLNMSQMLSEEILTVDDQLLSIERATGELSGTTALVALLHDDMLTVANVGDSRGVMCAKDGNTVPLSFDHKPQNSKERKRIKKAGGFISFSGVWRVAGILATSRALGDFSLKERNLVIAEPDILTFDLKEADPSFLILATDGLWDTFSNDEAVAFIKDRLDEPHYGAKSLVLQAYYRGSLDNITVMVVNLRNRTAVKVQRKGSLA